MRFSEGEKKKLRKNHTVTLFREAKNEISLSLSPALSICRPSGKGNDGTLSLCLVFARSGPSAGEREGRGFDEDDDAAAVVDFFDAPVSESTSSPPRSRLCERRRLERDKRHFKCDSNDDSRRPGASSGSSEAAAAARSRKGDDVASELVVVADGLFSVFVVETEIQQGILRARGLARAHRPDDRGQHEEGQGMEMERRERERERENERRARGGKIREQASVIGEKGVGAAEEEKESGGPASRISSSLSLSRFFSPPFSSKHHQYINTSNRAPAPASSSSDPSG